MSEPQVTLTVVRHGATDWSQSGRHTGRTDLPLLPEGQDEARQVGRRLAGFKPVLVLSSPLARALDSCRLAGFGADVALTADLLEMNYGEYEGLTTSQIRDERPDWDLYRDGCPGGETIDDVGKRVDGLIERLQSDAGLAGLDVLLFAHGHVLRTLAARWLELPAAAARRFALPSGHFGRLGWEHEWTVVDGWGL